MSRRSASAIILLLIMGLGSSLAFGETRSKNGPPVRGYAPYLYQMTKKVHELGFIFSSSAIYLESPEFGGTVYSPMIGLTYEYNINPYVSWYSEINGTYSPFVKRKDFSGDKLEFTTATQISASILTGARAHPWENWVYFGTGVGFRYFQAIASGDLKEGGMGLSPQFYFDAGLSFPMKNLNFEVGYRFRGSLMGSPLQKYFDRPSDPTANVNIGEIVFRLSIPVGEETRTEEQKWLDPRGNYDKQPQPSTNNTQQNQGVSS